MDRRLLLQRTPDLYKVFVTLKIFKELNEVKRKIIAFQNLKQNPPSEDKQNSKISIVIPTLNESEYIKNPILSLNANKYKNFEIIIVDCMSEDDTTTKAQKLGAKIVTSKKRNVGYQTHLGFTAATGEIILRTDADTIFPNNILAKIATTFKNQKIQVYHVGHMYYDGSILLNLLAHLYDKYWRKAWATTGHFIAVRKNAYNKITFKPLPKGQDYDFGKRAYQTLGKQTFAYDPNTTVFISARTIKKHKLLRYIIKQVSFKQG